ncbi:SAM-dependent methyltransferase [Alkalihalobacillus sp. LMS39]|uniref:class I SAM-dependent methyltransferase n=1 Tax=Alkalihalobacillus sp. LMS39 TaxID=2924032 RepID=UPI001FB3B346|nr:SAM-dependent methyltransferase [Alkalihalobacillus sp. LMS39]UOE95887.1 SAM-dependent methyltransferase [Alkalihalobacillus sp. LMS39]
MLLDYIIASIEANEQKQISYSEFMSLALYHPQFGYYMKEKQKVGKTGDFYTSSNVSTVFAEVFAQQFIDIWQSTPLPFHICEFGAGTGRFAFDVLTKIKELSTKTYNELTYSIVETSPYHLHEQKQRLKEHRNVHYYRSIDELQTKPFSGIVFSNELLDAFPVDVVSWDHGQLYEIKITMDENSLLQEVKTKCDRAELHEWLHQYGPPLQEGQRIEIPLAMKKWVQQLAEWVDQAVIFTLDYGYTKKDWEQPERKDGSLRGYYEHQMITNPLLHPGEMDLTTHIHLDALIEMGTELGFQLQFANTQDKFLIDADILSYLQDHHNPDPFSAESKRNRAIRSLLTMSTYFYVIKQTKGM